MRSPPRDDVWHIYVLLDPRSGAVRYVGKTNDMPRRLERHICERPKKPTWKWWWIQSLVKLGLAPTIQSVQTGSGDSHKEAERNWIAAYRLFGSGLTNIADGGYGGSGPCTEEHRRKLSLAMMGRKLSPASIEKLRQSQTGKKQSEETKRRRSAALTGRTVAPETGAKIAATKIGKPRSPETRAKLSAALMGSRLSDETRSKLKVSQAERRHRERQARNLPCPSLRINLLP